MDKPPVTLFHPSYVVEFAFVDSSITFIDRQTLNVHGKWLGPPPKLAICKIIETSEYHLSHCDNNWNDLRGVQTDTSIENIEEIAEKHYQGICKNWISTNHKQTEAEEIFLEEENKNRCSFCKNSYYDQAFTTLIGEESKICSFCVNEFYEIINGKNP